MTNIRLEPKNRSLRWWPLWIGIIVILGIIIVRFWWCWSGSTTTVLLVRHAERTSGDALNPTGHARAQELVHVTAKADLDAIYVTEYQRTQETADPLSTALDLTPIQMSGSDSQALADDILANHAGDRVLVVGHSNTVPEIIAALGGPTMGNLSENEFDNLFVLTRSSRGTELIELHYGNPTPP